MATSRLHELSEHGVSVWIDSLSREWLETGELKRLMEEDAVVGVTSNPTIFQKSMAEAGWYDEQLGEVLKETDDLKEVFFVLAEEDIRRACDLLKPVWERTGGVDGFVSFEVRVDAEADKRREALGNTALQGKLAVANAKLAYQHYPQVFSGPRWEFLAAKGAKPQRCLWASTSTKNPAYRDVLYVEELIGPDTVNTLPQATIDAFKDHGKVARTLDKDVDQARATMQALAEVGIDYDAVTKQLEDEGVASFA